MRLTRRKRPPDLREALRAAERRGRGAARRRFGTWLRRLPMAGWFFLLFLAVLAAGGSGLLREHAAAWLDASAPSPSMPRVRYGIPEGTAPPGIPASGTFAARVTVVDGDTLATGGGRLRLHGVDAPESAQTCRRRGSDYPCGQEASRAMARILGGGTLSCQVLDTDRYGRRVARCRNAQGTDIGAELVRQGWAIAFTRYSADYVRQESEARAARRGMWEGSFETPSDWRARRRP